MTGGNILGSERLARAVASDQALARKQGHQDRPVKIGKSGRHDLSMHEDVAMAAVEKRGPLALQDREYVAHLKRVMPWIDRGGNRETRTLPGVRNRFGKVSLSFVNGEWVKRG